MISERLTGGVGAAAGVGVAVLAGDALAGDVFELVVADGRHDGVAADIGDSIGEPL